jgi:hypothetical protein
MVSSTRLSTRIRLCVCDLRSRSGAIATTPPSKGNGYATGGKEGRQDAVTPLFSEAFRQAASSLAIDAIAPDADRVIQIRKARRGNCW